VGVQHGSLEKRRVGKMVTITAAERRRIFRRVWKSQESALPMFLQKLGRGVEFDPEKNRLVLVGSSRMSESKRKRVVRIRNVTARRAKGYLASTWPEWPPRSSDKPLQVESFSEVTFLQGSERVLTVEYAR
jgi:hypothetical protein